MEQQKARIWSISLRDPVWQFISVVVTIVVFAIGFWAAGQSKAISVSFLVDSPVVSVQEGLSQDIQILYKGKNVKELSLLQMKVKNIGNQAITEADYAKPIIFVFPENSNILEGVVLESYPANIGMTMQVKQNQAILSSVLLNPGDQVTLRFLITNIANHKERYPFTINARITGVQEISLEDYTTSEF